MIFSLKVLINYFLYAALSGHYTIEGSDGTQISQNLTFHENIIFPLLLYLGMLGPR